MNIITKTPQSNLIKKHGKQVSKNKQRGENNCAFGCHSLTWWSAGANLEDCSGQTGQSLF
jgi:hypothetical protein